MLKLFCYKNLTIKQWLMPFCAFFTTFTVVMTLLILSTDINNRHYAPFNTTILWDFEGISQDSTRLINLIKSNYIKNPQVRTRKKVPVLPAGHLLKLLKKKRGGIYMELGATLESDTSWLEKSMKWRGLLTQPYPHEYLNIVSAGRKSSHTAPVCISPDNYPKHADFRNSTTATNETLTAVPCFPLYSLMRAYNTSTVDFLVLNDVDGPLQVLKTLPVGKVHIDLLSFVLQEDDDTDFCCSDDAAEILRKWGYKRTTDCPASGRSCYFKCSSKFCPAPGTSKTR